MTTLWKCVAEPSGNPPGPPHAARTTHARTTDKIDAPAACATFSATRPFQREKRRFILPFRPYCAGVATRTRNVSE